MNAEKKDLLLLVADASMEAAVKGGLRRPGSLRIRSVSNDVYVHPERDPGCCKKGDAFLKVFQNQYQYAILMFDREGCGSDKSATELEAECDDALSRSGWGERAKTIVIDPELEVWVWSDSPHVDDVLGWKGRSPKLRQWLREKGYWREGEIKPSCPKEALEAALDEVGQPRSAGLYGELASRVSLSQCSDRAFVRFREVLQKWFPPAG